MTDQPADRQPSPPPGLELVLGALAEQRRARRSVLSTSADRAARTVREEVVEGRLRSGTRLPEEHLAAALGVSRNTLREALSQLVAERILVREPHRGVLVATPDPDDVEDVYRVRRLLEPAVLREAAGGSEDRLAGLSAAVEEGRTAAAAGDWDGVASANQHFHRAVVALARSPRLDAMMELMLAEMRLFFHQMDGAEEFHRPYLEENARIAEHVAAGRCAEAADAMSAYLRAAERQLVEAFRTRDRSGPLHRA